MKYNEYPPFCSSVNCITSLSDIQNCRNLQELYIRKNKIADLSEVCWLRDLTKLKSLWLEENPCVQDQGELYVDKAQASVLPSHK